jgi:hypothetical protein
VDYDEGGRGRHSKGLACVDTRSDNLGLKTIHRFGERDQISSR